MYHVFVGLSPQRTLAGRHSRKHRFLVSGSCPLRERFPGEPFPAARDIRYYSDMPELLLLPPDLSPAPDDPVQVYLDQLGPGSRASIRSSVRVISPHLAPAGGQVHWERLCYRDIAALRAWLVDTYAPATAARHLQAALGILREAFRLGLLSADAWMRVREVRAVSVRPRRNGRLVDEADVDRLQRAAGKGAAGSRDAALLWVLLGAGVRRSEAVAADLEDYEMATGVLWVRSVKHGFPRAIPLEDDARAALEAWLDVRGGWPGPLLTAVDQRDRVVRRRLTTSGVYFLLRRLAGRAGTGRVRPHDLRKSFHRHAIDPNGRALDVFEAARLLGHRGGLGTSYIHYDLRGMGAGLQESRAPYPAREDRHCA